MKPQKRFTKAIKALRELMNDVYPHKTKTCRKLRDVYHVGVDAQERA